MACHNVKLNMEIKLHIGRIFCTKELTVKQPERSKLVLDHRLDGRCRCCALVRIRAGARMMYMRLPGAANSRRHWLSWQFICMMPLKMLSWILYCSSLTFHTLVLVLLKSKMDSSKNRVRFVEVRQCYNRYHYVGKTWKEKLNASVSLTS